MKLRTPLRCSSAMLLLFIAGCAYENEEIYNKEISQPEHQITFKLDKYNDADTIYLSGPETFSYEVGINL